MLRARITLWVLMVLCAAGYASIHAQKSWMRRQLTPAEAIAAMSVPAGFSVELVASEPEIAHPVAMTFDDRGRIWLIESPSGPAGDSASSPGRILILESSRGDGVYDKMSPFPAHLRMPSGLAIGHGGVWVADAPDILFFPIRDGVLGPREVIVSGFGKEDTNGLPNSLMWGPDGWLYGLSSVWCLNHVVHQGKTFDFSCAVFRIHPHTRAFELFAEGTSNPWGLTWDTEGNAFICGCVSDHLWHMTQTGVYRRIAGAYPAFSWQLGSIVKRLHKGHSHCGLHFFDSDVYPPPYRGKLYMGNVTSNDVNVDGLKRQGATYVQVPAPDFIGGGSPWFTPVALKTGPDGLLYVLDWHDRRHCDHDMLRVPRTANHLLGRLYRVRYGPTYRPAGRFDLVKESDEQLVERLRSPNIYFRDTAQRLLVERNSPASRALLRQFVFDGTVPRTSRMHALWALIGGGTLKPAFHRALLNHPDPAYRAWGVRAAGDCHRVAPAVRKAIACLAGDIAPEVRLQVAIAVSKIEGLDPLPPLLQVARTSSKDPLIPAIVWQNLLPLLDRRAPEFLTALEQMGPAELAELSPIVARAVGYLVTRPSQDPTRMVALFTALTENNKVDVEVSREVMASLADKIQTGEISAAQRTAVQDWARSFARKVLQDRPDHPCHLEAVLLAATLRDAAGVALAHKLLCAPEQTQEVRLKALAALIAGRDSNVLACVAAILREPAAAALSFQGQVLAALGRSKEPAVATVVLARFPRMDPNLQTQAVELLIQRPSWSKQLLGAIQEHNVPVSALSSNQVRQLLASKDAGVAAQVLALWGTVRKERDPARAKVVSDMRDFLRHNHGDASAGLKVFHKMCGQCHKIYGQGADVGPDLTSVGRASYDQLLSKVFDPNQFIKAGYKVVTAYTTSGRVVTGLVVEDNAARLVLKTQGGNVETIARDDLDTVVPSRVSLMPEGIETLLRPQELADLFAMLTLDRPPNDARARKIPGAPR